MKPFDNEVFMQQMKELTDMIDEYEFQEMEAAYLEQLKKLEADLSNQTAYTVPDYIDSLENRITNLKFQIIERFSVHNKHLTEKYMDQLIQTDRILFAQLYYTTKVDDCEQYLLAKKQYTLKYKDILHSNPEICALPGNLN